MQLLENRVLIKPIELENKTKGGIIIPDSAKGRSNRGTVLQVGSGYTIKEGEIAGTKIPMQVKVDDEVMYDGDAGQDIQIEGIKSVLILEDNIFVIL
jgi:chaperonin GroES